MVLGIASVGAPACRKAEHQPPKPQPAPAATGPAVQRDPYDPLLRAPFAPVPIVAESAENPVTPEKVELGRMLYFDKRLSKNHDVACQTCHELTKYGADNTPTSEGHMGRKGTRNSPTVFNAGLHFRQFWDGRAATLEDQAKGPMMNPVEMAVPDEARIVKTLESIPPYGDAFKKASPGNAHPITLDNAAKAIGAFERELLTPSRWDAFLEGKRDALTLTPGEVDRHVPEVDDRTADDAPDHRADVAAEHERDAEARGPCSRAWPPRCGRGAMKSRGCGGSPSPTRLPKDCTTRWSSSAGERTDSGTSRTTGCGSARSADRSLPSVSLTQKRGLAPAFGEEPEYVVEEGFGGVYLTSAS
jgi:hypothetical protein